MTTLLFSSLYYVLIMAAIFVFASFVLERISFFKERTRAEPKSEHDHKERSRHETLDGLRGVLALGVLFQHAVTNYAYYQTGVWQITPERFFRHAGGESVILFFMITSFLYWSKAIAAKGNISPGRLYKSRFKRLAPMYLFSAAIVTVAALVQTQFVIHSWPEFINNILSWLTLGLITTTEVNNVSVIPINAGIHWTLHFEWIFYLVLPFTALILREGLWRFLMIPIGIITFMLPGWGYWIIFYFGVLAAHIVHLYPRVDMVKKKWFGIVPIAGLLLVYCMSYKPYSVPQYAVSLCILLCFIYGNSLFGLLKTRAAIFLGTISYSVYLMHGIVLYAVLGVSNIFIPIISLSAIGFWSLILLSGLLTVSVSAWTYRYVEHPFIGEVMKK
jgi:peptidoglycan/LPS O-acetylase OafA/YrhL